MARFATVSAISGSGKVYAVNAHAVQREVLVNDSVEMGEILKTVGDVWVQLVTDDLRTLHLDPDQILQLEDSAFLAQQTPSPTPNAPDAALATPASDPTIIDALNRGQDLSTTLDATAAGPGDADGGGGGSSFVQLGRVSESVSGNTYGFDFLGLDVPPLTQTQGQTLGQTQPAEQTAPSTSGPGISAAITLNPVAVDNIINNQEAQFALTAIVGSVGGDVRAGDRVTITVNDHIYTGSVVPNALGLGFNISVVTTDLLLGLRVLASVTTTAADGSSATATDSTTPLYDNPSASIRIVSVAADNIVNNIEALGQVSTVGSVGGSAKPGDTVTISVISVATGEVPQNYTGTVNSNGQFVIALPASMVAGHTVVASVNGSNAAGSIYNASTRQDVAMDSTQVSIALNPISVPILDHPTTPSPTTTISGSVGGDAVAGDSVTFGNLRVAGSAPQTTVQALPDGTLGFSVAVPTDALPRTGDLAQGGAFTSVTASITHTTAAGSAATATASTVPSLVDLQTATVSLSASTDVAEGADASYLFTATLSQVSQGVTTVSTDKGVIQIADGQSSGQLQIPGNNAEDVYKDASSLTARIGSVAGGGFDHLVVAAGAASATATIVDTSTLVTATLSASSTALSAYGGSVSYSVSLGTNLGISQASYAPLTELKILLSNGDVVTIPAGSTVGTVSHSYTRADIAAQSSISTSLLGVQSGGGEYENLQLAPAPAQVPVYGLQVGDNSADTLTGRDGNDVIAGDTGGLHSAYTPGATANIAFVLDVSMSMLTNYVRFTDTQGHSMYVTRLAAMQQALDNALVELTTPNRQGHLAANVMVHLDQFSNSGGYVGAGSFQIVRNGVVQTATLQAAQDAIHSLANLPHATTNYEAGLQSTLNWLNSSGAGAPLANADVRQVIFLSDGDPNLVYVGNSTDPASAMENLTAPDAIRSILGTLGGPHADNVSEVGLITAKGYTIDAVGVALSDPTTLGYLTAVEGAAIADGHQPQASDINTANQLSSVIHSILSGTDVPTPDDVGADTVRGGAGNDILFGDTPNTDALAGNASGAYGAAGSHDGAGMDVLYHSDAVPHTDALAASDADVLAWLGDPAGDYAHAQSLNVAGDTRGGNDLLDGGAGNDLLFAQGGNDTLIGGAGNDLLYGGTGSNTFVWKLGDQGTAAAPATDTVMDFKVGTGGDVLDLRDLLQSEHAQAGAGTAAVLNNYLHFSQVSGDVVLSVDHQASGQVAQTITLAHFSLDSLQTALGASSSSDLDLITRMLATGHLQTEA